MDGDQARRPLVLRIAETLAVTRTFAAPNRAAPASSKRTSSPFCASCVAPRATRHSFSCLRSTGSMTPPPAGRLAEDAELASRGAGEPLDGPRLIGGVGGGPERRDPRQDAIADAGGGTLILLALDDEDARRRAALLGPGRRTGDELAMGSRSTISITVTDGNTPGRWSFRREPAISPSSAMSRNSSFRATRSPPLTPKARAISRLPVRSPELCRKSRIACFEGSLPTGWVLGGDLVLATSRSSTGGFRERASACRLLHRHFLFLRLLCLGCLAGGLLRRSLGGPGGEQLHGLEQRDLLRGPDPWAGWH